MPASMPAQDLSALPLDWLEAFVLMTASHDGGDPDAEFRHQIDAIYRMRDIEHRDSISKCHDVTAAVIELGRRRGIDMPGPDRAPRRRGRGTRPDNWRVFGIRPASVDCTSAVKAEAAASLLRAVGEPVAVWRWLDDAWKLYSHSEPTCHPYPAAGRLTTKPLALESP